MSSFTPADALKYVDQLAMAVGFGVTALTTWLLCRLSQRYSIGQDTVKGVQKFHHGKTSRLGGLAIFFGLVLSCLAASALGGGWVSPLGVEEPTLSAEFQRYFFWMLLCATPVWLAGLAEDLTHRVGPTLRLVMATMSAAWLFGSLGASVSRTDVWPIDLLLSMPGAPLCVTLLVVAGFTHSVNIVDGFHGLACGLVVITLASLACMAWTAGDALILKMCAISIAATLGFFVLNWPRGAIFLGDAGAYLIGFWTVELGILLAMRNPEISPMAPVVAGLLPLIETLFSMYRRKVVRNLPVNQPDALHLHTLVYRRLLMNPSLRHKPKQLNYTNASVAIYFWLPAAFFAALSCLFLHSTHVQLGLMLAYLLMYNWLYKRLVRFNSPAWMRFRT
jgi:UDP-N-acetylmuramyl pentapeptide phosphotransferase/UDP-N-acetylglucosamine-1-phosphate transferase